MAAGKSPSAPHLLLTGFMGSGKTAVGRRLAAALGRPFADLDEQIAAAAGMSISGIFAVCGEEYFRELESRLLARLLYREQPLVIATGGGAVVREANRELMRRRGRIIFLAASLETILRRTAADDSRPLLAGAAAARRSKIKDLLAARRSFYDIHDLSIDTDGKTIAEITREITARLGLDGSS
ncbi:MAG: shikimate kinase [Deltaproteobacteria bacterium]|nr:shikimate kinase [Deltaproteobacteria bacterium]